MGPYSETISKLLDSSQPRTESVYFLSAYLPKNNRNKAEVKKHIKSHLFEAFRNHPELKKDKDLRHEVIRAVQEKVDLLDALRRGLAIFVRIDLGELRGESVSLAGDNVEVLALNREPKREVRIEDTYDVDQLVWMNNIAAMALVISLRGKEARLYHVDLSGIEPERKEEVPVELEREPEYLEGYAPIDFRELYHGTGADKLSRMREMEREQLINDVKEVINSPAVPCKCEFLVIFASSAFSTLVSKLTNDATVAPRGTEVIVEHKNIEDEKELKVEAQKKIAQAQEGRKKRLLSRAQESPKQYVEGWQNVADAAREGSIAALFVKPDLEMKGYVLDGEIPHLQKYPGTRPVNNLAPWIVRRVVQTGGEVVVLRGSNNTDEVPDIAAFLRYNKT